MSEKFTLLLVDDEPLNLNLLKHMLQEKYTLIFARSGEKAIELAKNLQPDLILLDIMMPNMDGHEVCLHLKAHSETNQIPVIFVTAMADITDEEKGFTVGAVDYLTKPVNSAIVHARIQTHLELANQRQVCEQQVIERTAELERSQRAAIHMLGQAGHYNDTDTGEHIWRMAAYSSAIARALNWSVEAAEDLQLAAPMHDTGKIGTPDAILKAPRSLTKEEWSTMKEHTTVGHQILSSYQCPLFELAANIALHHHEKWDGSGYPQGLEKENIPESALIVAVADVFDALTMKRPYKEAWSIEKSVNTLKEDSGTHFAPHVIEAFVSILPEIIEIKDHWNDVEEQSSTTK